MSTLIPFVFEEHLVRVTHRDELPWFVGKDVCMSLGLRNHNDALASLDQDEKGVATTDPRAPGGEQTMVVVSEPGVYRLVFRSRKPEAERFKRWLAHEVLPALRRTGRFEAQPSPPSRDILAEPLLHRLQVVREARCVHGRDAARVMWSKLGLPPPPPPPRTALDEARELLRHLLDSPAADGSSVRALIAEALEEDEPARLTLLACGIRVFPERDAFVVANQSPWIAGILRGTSWAAEPLAHVRILRRLPEAAPSGMVRMAALQSRGTQISAAALDEFVR